MFTERDPTSSVSVPHARSSVGTARHALSDELQASGVAPRVREDAVLVLSELVSNAIKHAAPLPGGQITIRWVIRPDFLHLEITDGGAVTRPRAGAPAASAISGRGLDIVRRVCSQWGVTEDEETVTVWADLPRPSAQSTRSLRLPESTAPARH